MIVEFLLWLFTVKCYGFRTTWALFETILRNGFFPCDLSSNGTDIECVNAVIEEMDAGQRKCTCNVECEELNYELSITQSDWPSKQYEVKAVSPDFRNKKHLTNTLSYLCRKWQWQHMDLPQETQGIRIWQATCWKFKFTSHPWMSRP